MPNTKSAERRVRETEHKRKRNQSVKSRVKSVEKEFQDLTEKGKTQEALEAFRKVSSVLDRAAKVGVIRKQTADRKKSRLARRLKPQTVQNT